MVVSISDAKLAAGSQPGNCPPPPNFSKSSKKKKLLGTTSYNHLAPQKRNIRWCGPG